MTRRTRSHPRLTSPDERAQRERADALRETLRHWAEEPEQPGEWEAWLEVRRGLDEDRPPEHKLFV
jgi:hypothetical protein